MSTLRTERDYPYDAQNISFLSGDSEVLREREIRKHIGDYSLFMDGIFKEYVERNTQRTPNDPFTNLARQ